MYILTTSRCGGMVDTLDSKSSGGNLMSVRLRPAVPWYLCLFYCYNYCMYKVLRTLGIFFLLLGFIDGSLNVFTPQSLPLLHASGGPALNPDQICPAIGVSYQGFPFDTRHYGVCGIEYASLPNILNWAIVVVFLLLSGFLIFSKIMKKRR